MILCIGLKAVLIASNTLDQDNTTTAMIMDTIFKNKFQKYDPPPKAGHGPRTVHISVDIQAIFGIVEQSSFFSQALFCTDME